MIHHVITPSRKPLPHRESSHRNIGITRHRSADRLRARKTRRKGIPTPAPTPTATSPPAQVAITWTSPSSKAGIDDLLTKTSNLANEPTLLPIRTDLRDPSAPALIIAQVIAQLGPQIDILVNNAGCEIIRPAQDVTADDFSHIYDLNVRAIALLTAAIIPYLPKSGGGGRIINIGSVGGRSGFKDLSLYCSSKAAVEGLTRCHAAELGKGGHTVNCVCPGPVPTDVLKGIPRGIVEEQMRNTPMEQRLGSTDDIAQVVAWLAEEGSRWVTGQTISASGGNCMW